MSGIARIKVDQGRRIGEVDPRIYGGFIEHLGRCIYGGIFEEGSPFSDERGFRKDVLGALDKLGLTSLRWPGRLFANGYHWEDGIGARSTRPAASTQRGGTRIPTASALTNSSSTAVLSEPSPPSA